MAMGRQGDRQGDLMVSWCEMPRSPGHVFYDRLQEILVEGGFDAFAQNLSQSIAYTYNSPLTKSAVDDGASALDEASSL